MNLPLRTALIFLTGICLLSLPGLAEEELSVEGIVYESKNPQESMAVVNSALLSRGETIKGYTIGD